MTGEDATHELIMREIHRVEKRVQALELDIMSLKDAFWAHTHEEDRPFEVNHGHEP